MANIQHQDARKLLRIITSAVANRTDLTYWAAAKLMGRVPPQYHSRAVAQMCDLLDAAACLAGVPLLALVAVREKSGEINPKAWKKEFGARRDAIIKRSLDHRFGPGDFDAIAGAINDLGQRGNIRAWRYLEGLYPGDLLYRRIIGAYKTPSQTLSMTLGRMRRIAQSQKYGPMLVIQGYGMRFCAVPRASVNSAANSDS